MRTKTMFVGLKNTQKIRVIVSGVGFYTTVRDVPNICTSEHRSAVEAALVALSTSLSEGKQITGFGTRAAVVDSTMQTKHVDVQVDLA